MHSSRSSAKLFGWTATEVRNSVKVELTKEEKRAIGRPSSRRWEIDVVAYSGKLNLLLAVKCKSFLNSRRVALRGFDGSSEKEARRYQNSENRLTEQRK